MRVCIAHSIRVVTGDGAFKVPDECAHKRSFARSVPGAAQIENWVMVSDKNHGGSSGFSAHDEFEVRGAREGDTEILLNLTCKEGQDLGAGQINREVVR